MTAFIGAECVLLKRDELVAQIDKGRLSGLAAKFEVEQAAVECQSPIDIADLKSDVIEADGARFLCFWPKFEATSEFAPKALIMLLRSPRPRAGQFFCSGISPTKYYDAGHSAPVLSQ